MHQCLSNMNKSQKQKVCFLDFFTALNCFICGPFGPFYGPKWQISLPFHILQLVKSFPFHIPGPCKRYLFRVEPPGMGHCRAQWGWDLGLRVSRKCSSFKKYFNQCCCDSCFETLYYFVSLVKSPALLKPLTKFYIKLRAYKRKF